MRVTESEGASPRPGLPRAPVWRGRWPGKHRKRLALGSRGRAGAVPAARQGNGGHRLERADRTRHGALENLALGPPT